MAISQDKIHQAIVISPFMSFITLVLSQDHEVKVHAGLIPEKEFHESIFSYRSKIGPKSRERSKYIKEAKINLYQFLIQAGYGKQMVIAQSKQLPIVERYYSHFFKMYDKFAKEKGTHIPILFIGYALQYLKRKNVLSVEEHITDQDTMFGLLVYKSNIPVQERWEYRDLVNEMFGNLGRVKLLKKKRVSKTRKK